MNNNEQNSTYAYGFDTLTQSTSIEAGLTDQTIRQISQLKNEPEWMLDFRLEAFKKWQTMSEPHWGNIDYEPLNYNEMSYYSAPKKIDNAIKETYDKLGIPLNNTGSVAMDVIFDSVSIHTSFQEELAQYGIIFCPISQAILKYPDLVKKYLGSVIPPTDNFYAALNSAVFSDGSFVYIPKGVKCPMDISSYFRINAQKTGQFERTLIIADEGSSVSYLEGCTAPERSQYQLHAGIVEIVVLDNAYVKYSTVQNWYPGNKDGIGGVYNFVSKRGICHHNARLSWTQVETGSAKTWKYPSCILKGDNSVGEFFSVALTHNYQQADTGTKMIHIGKNTKSTIISKGISAGHSHQTYRGLVQINKTAENARNFSKCDNLLIGDLCRSYTIPVQKSRCSSAILEHEASTSKISEEQLFYAGSRGLDENSATSLIVNGFCQDVMHHLPLEFAIEAKALIEKNLKG